MWGIKKVTLALCLIGSGAFAASVGPLDGKAGPTLPALGMPTLAAEENLASTALAETLEDQGLLAAAQLEYARFAEESRGTEREHGLEKVAELAYRQNQPEAAQTVITTLQTDFPAHMLSAPLLKYHLQHISPAARQSILTDLTQTQPRTQASIEARWADVWQQALKTGRITHTWAIPQAVMLETRLASLRRIQTLRYHVTVAASVIPGAGYMLQGEPLKGLVLLLGWFVLGWAYLSACRHRHYAYAFVFVFPWVGVWLNAPMAAGALADQKAFTHRTLQMAQWQDLKPTYKP